MLSRQARVTRSAGLSLAVLGSVLVLSGTAQGQLLQDRLALIPPKVNLGEGTVRLDGMGGFQIAVPDENNELNLHDYSSNPAGYSDDKDSWSIDIRYTHDEYLEQSPVTAGNDIKTNDGTFILGFHRPLRLGVGGHIDYSEAITRDFTHVRKDYRVNGFGLTANKYVFPRLSLGLRVGRSGENENTLSREIYRISHTSNVLRGTLGAGYRLTRGVILGGMFEASKSTLDGESRSNVHTDVFTWDRPGHLWAVQGFVNRGRLRGAVDYSRQHREGDEAVDLSWSERFVYNPTNGAYTAHTETFSEKRTDKLFRTRWQLDVVPGELAVSGAFSTAKGDADVITNPNAIGSLTGSQIKTSGHTVMGGASWTGLAQRLLLAGEVAVETSDYESLQSDPQFKSTRDAVTGRAGLEYLLGESLAGRVGFTHTRETLKRDETDVDTGTTSRVLDDTYGTSVVSVGMGVVPRGAIFQLDLALQVIVKSGLETDRTRFATGVRYLF